MQITPSWLKPELLQGMLRGVEKEGLRVTADGELAKTPHPKALGSKLTHPSITTDFSESLLELITAPHDSVESMLGELKDLHRVVVDAMNPEELIWPLSMPCVLSETDSDIPLANYGSSNIAKLKTLYRNGLGLRYGRRMQTIAGLHYNLSFPDALFDAWQEAEADTKEAQEFKNARYLGLIRNMKRSIPAVLYFFGASPAVCACFVTGRSHNLKALTHNKSTLGLAEATSLRMGRLGYQNSAQDDLQITYNDLSTYTQGLRGALSIKHKPFTKLGLDSEDGTPLQINDHILQIENEFYSVIRPKQVAASGETPTQALERRGIRYVELRALDLNPYEAYGLSAKDAYFVELLMLHALLSPSPRLEPAEESMLARNQEVMTEIGRKDDLMLETLEGETPLRDWLGGLLAELSSLAKILDQNYPATPYADALAEKQAQFENPDLLPSKRVVNAVTNEGSLWQFGKQLATTHLKTHRHHVLKGSKRSEYQTLAHDSVVEQHSIEASDKMGFKQFLQAYR